MRKVKQERSDLSQLSAESGEPKRRSSVLCAYYVPPDRVCPSVILTEAHHHDMASMAGATVLVS